MLQCSLVELWNDLYSSQYGLGNIVLDNDGTKLVFLGMLKSLLPPELQPISNLYKMTCCCEYCISMEYLQNALNRYRVELKSSLEKKTTVICLTERKKKGQKKKRKIRRCYDTKKKRLMENTHYIPKENTQLLLVNVPRLPILKMKDCHT